MSSGAGFDNERYLEKRSRVIVERSERIGGNLYLGFRGNIAFDFHAVRVLPGNDPTVRVRLLQRPRNQVA